MLSKVDFDIDLVLLFLNFKSLYDFEKNDFWTAAYVIEYKKI